MHIRASSTASRATWYGVGLTWGLRGGLTGVGEVVGARRGEGGEGCGVSNGGSGEASSLKHFSASESHGGIGGCSANRKSSGRSPQPHSGNEGLEGAEEATLRGLDDMANCSLQWVGDKRVGARSGRPNSNVWVRDATVYTQDALPRLKGEVDNKRVPYV